MSVVNQAYDGRLFFLPTCGDDAFCGLCGAPGGILFSRNWATKRCCLLFSKQGKKGHFYPSRKVLQNRTIFLSNSTQILPKFLPGSTLVEDGRFLDAFSRKFAAALVADATSFSHIYAFNKYFFCCLCKKTDFCSSYSQKQVLDGSKRLQTTYHPPAKPDAAAGGAYAWRCG